MGSISVRTVDKTQSAANFIVSGKSPFRTPRDMKKGKDLNLFLKVTRIRRINDGFKSSLGPYKSKGQLLFPPCRNCLQNKIAKSPNFVPRPAPLPDLSGNFIYVKGTGIRFVFSSDVFYEAEGWGRRRVAYL